MAAPPPEFQIQQNNTEKRRRSENGLVARHHWGIYVAAYRETPGKRQPNALPSSNLSEIERFGAERATSRIRRPISALPLRPLTVLGQDQKSECAGGEACGGGGLGASNQREAPFAGARMVRRLSAAQSVPWRTKAESANRTQSIEAQFRFYAH